MWSSDTINSMVIEKKLYEYKTTVATVDRIRRNCCVTRRKFCKYEREKGLVGNAEMAEDIENNMERVVDKPLF